jgi:hypothetical protein
MSGGSAVSDQDPRRLIEGVKLRYQYAKFTHGPIYEADILALCNALECALKEGDELDVEKYGVTWRETVDRAEAAEAKVRWLQAVNITWQDRCFTFQTQHEAAEARLEERDRFHAADVAAVAAAEAEVARQTRIAGEHLQDVRNLLARIFRDGGHYVEEHGMEHSLRQSDTVVANYIGEAEEVEALRAEVERLKAEVERLKAEVESLRLAELPVGWLAAPKTDWDNLQAEVERYKAAGAPSVVVEALRAKLALYEKHSACSVDCKHICLEEVFRTERDQARQDLDRKDQEYAEVKVDFELSSTGMAKQTLKVVALEANLALYEQIVEAAKRVRREAGGMLGMERDALVELLSLTKERAMPRTSHRRIRRRPRLRRAGKGA